VQQSEGLRRDAVFENGVFSVVGEGHLVKYHTNHLMSVY
jgi:hypothetical protein